MKALSDGHFSPITHAWGFFEAPLPVVRDRLIGWRLSLKRRIKTRSATGTLSDALGLLDPLTTPWDKELLVSTNSPWTAYFNNQSIGGDPGSVAYLAQLVSCCGLTVISHPDGSSGFCLYSPKQTDFLNVRRVVQALNDGNSEWVFSERGSPLPFEEVARYSRRLVKERLDAEMLERYFAEFGIRLFDEDFYGGGYTQLSLRQQGKSFSLLSLEDYRRGLPSKLYRTSLLDRFALELLE